MKREIDVYRNGLMFERDNVVGITGGQMRTLGNLILIFILFVMWFVILDYVALLSVGGVIATFVFGLCAEKRINRHSGALKDQHQREMADSVDGGNLRRRSAQIQHDT